MATHGFMTVMADLLEITNLPFSSTSGPAPGAHTASFAMGTANYFTGSRRAGLYFTSPYVYMAYSLTKH
jgi:hypothetical protein